MHRIRQLLLVFLGGMFGFVLAWWSSGRMSQRAYRSVADIVLVNREGKPVGSIPAGTVLESSEQLGNPDLGWWGSVTVYLGAPNIGLQRSRPRFASAGCR